mmetsp:Transcript_9119/g.35670  ORF Transcript_9119/g.35670 Transcript_9119/m.35670 type:complete len:393 (-) Transcript_9119:21-1199(-)
MSKGQTTPQVQALKWRAPAPQPGRGCPRSRASGCAHRYVVRTRRPGAVSAGAAPLRFWDREAVHNRSGLLSPACAPNPGVPARLPARALRRCAPRCGPMNGVTGRPLQLRRDSGSAPRLARPDCDAPGLASEQTRAPAGAAAALAAAGPCRAWLRTLAQRLDRDPLAPSAGFGRSLVRRAVSPRPRQTQRSSLLWLRQSGAKRDSRGASTSWLRWRGAGTRAFARRLSSELLPARAQRGAVTCRRRLPGNWALRLARSCAGGSVARAIVTLGELGARRASSRLLKPCQPRLWSPCSSDCGQAAPPPCARMSLKQREHRPAACARGAQRRGIAPGAIAARAAPALPCAATAVAAAPSRNKCPGYCTRSSNLRRARERRLVCGEVRGSALAAKC